MESDHLYFSHRAQEERVAAMKAPHPSARQAHLDMADRYDELAGAIAGHLHPLGTLGAVPRRPKPAELREQLSHVSD